MARIYFGTDGVRGVANTKLTPELALKLGYAAGQRFRQLEPNKQTVVIGRDTRLSGTMLEAALSAGFTSVGMNVVLLGVIPTPGVARIVVATGAAAGVVISASHNPYEDNGIKFFGTNGEKLPDSEEELIEALLDAEPARSRTGARSAAPIRHPGTLRLIPCLISQLYEHGSWPFSACRRMYSFDMLWAKFSSNPG